MTKIEIGLDDYFNGFYLNLKSLDHSIIAKSICVYNSDTNIIKISNKGLKIHSKNIDGDLYICFKLVKDSTRLHKYIDNSYITESYGFKNIIEDMNIYN